MRANPRTGPLSVPSTRASTVRGGSASVSGTQVRSGRPPSGGRSGHTGASSGFGRSIASAALAAGDTVVATARRPETLDDLVAAYPDRAVAAQLDVTDTARIGAVVADTGLWHGRIDVVVNNARAAAWPGRSRRAPTSNCWT